MTEALTNLEKLRVPFAANQIGKKPKGGVMLDFVGHAALTDRLLDVDPLWSWEPLALGDNGLPVFDAHGGLWIRLTVCGVTRLGYGGADSKKGENAVKEAIGDALRNAAMRFGAALDLWHKGDLHEAEPVAPAEHVVLMQRLVALCKSKEIARAEGQAQFEALGGTGQLADCTDVRLLSELIDTFKGA